MHDHPHSHSEHEHEHEHEHKHEREHNGGTETASTETASTETELDAEDRLAARSELVRFSVAIPESLLMQFDNLVARRGIAKNRSEVIRDLIRDVLVNEEWEDPQQEIVGTLTIVFNHHASDLQNKLDQIQHSHFQKIISAMHIHLDAHNCLEVVVLKGRSSDIRQLAESILGVKGVKHGQLTTTTTGRFL